MTQRQAVKVVLSSIARDEANPRPSGALPLVAEVERLHEAYRRAVDPSSHDVRAHGEPRKDPSEPDP